MKILIFFSCILFTLNVFSFNKKIKTGIWHAQFTLSETETLPITFSFERNKKKIVLYLINADESIELTDIKQKKDSLFIKFPAFDSELKLQIIKKNLVKGEWFNYSKGKDYSIPIICKNGMQTRFPSIDPNIDIYGKWEVTFDYETNPEKAIGIFDPLLYCSHSTVNMVKGTFLTETGDFRYLEGAVSHDSLFLSTFDGSHAFLFKSKLVNDTLWGDFLSGTHYKTKWYAVKNESFELTDPDSLTYLINQNPIQFSLPDLNNELYTYPNSIVNNKVTLIQIMGTWCPNCLDESNYLAQQKKRLGDKLEIIAITFETQETIEEKITKVKSYKDHFELDYTFLIGGKACKICANELFPMLNEIISFPTLIFIDKKGNVRRIHTGFNGPGTGKYYASFVEKTNMMLDQLIAE